MVYDLDSIKQRNPIADVIAAHDVAQRESGTHLVGRCPFHEDEHPSFAGYPETRSFYCFGCNAGGDPSTALRTGSSTSSAAPGVARTRVVIGQNGG